MFFLTHTAMYCLARTARASGYRRKHRQNTRQAQAPRRIAPSRSPLHSLPSRVNEKCSIARAPGAEKRSEERSSLVETCCPGEPREMAELAAAWHVGSVGLWLAECMNLWYEWLVCGKAVKRPQVCMYGFMQSLLSLWPIVGDTKGRGFASVLVAGSLRS